MEMDPMALLAKVNLEDKAKAKFKELSGGQKQRFSIAVISLFFYITSSKNIFDKHDHSTIKELTIVSEMSLTIGLFALTVGNFLGGIWANGCLGTIS